MANNDGRINFDVGLNINRTSLEQLRTSLQQIQNMTLDQFRTINNGLSSTQARRDFEAMKTSAKEIQKAFSQAYNPMLNSTNIARLNQELQHLNLDQIYTNFKRAGAAGYAAMNSISSATLKTNLQLRESHKILDEIAVTFKNTVKWTATSSIVNRMADSIQEAWSYTKGLDTDLNDIRIVTNKSANEMERFAVAANRAAKNLGATTRDYTRASLLFYQQGLEDEQVQARTDVVLKAANVTGQQASEVSEQLTAVWNGYRVSAEEAEMYIDKLAAVGANTASNLEELSTAMSKVASAASTAGVPIDNLNAILSTVISVTREAPETIGTAFKTIFARLGDLSLGGTDEEGVGLGNVSTKLHNLGVEVLDQQGQMREMGDIIEDVAKKWQTWTRAQQQAAAVAMAGKMQYSRLISLFENWDMYTAALNTSQDALGTLQEQQDIYMESTQAHLNKLRTAWEHVFDSSVNNQSINNIVDIFTVLVDKIGELIDALGGGGNALMTFGNMAAMVFSTQIARGLSTMGRNREAERYNRNQINQTRIGLEAEQRSNQRTMGRPDEGTTTRINRWNQMENFASALTTEQFTRGRDLFDAEGHAQSRLQQFQFQRDEQRKIADNIIQQAIRDMQRENPNQTPTLTRLNNQQLNGLFRDNTNRYTLNEAMTQGEAAAQRFQQRIDDVTKSTDNYNNALRRNSGVMQTYNEQLTHEQSILQQLQQELQQYHASDNYTQQIEQINTYQRELTETTQMLEQQQNLLQQLKQQKNDTYGRGKSPVTKANELAQQMSLYRNQNFNTTTNTWNSSQAETKYNNDSQRLALLQQQATEYEALMLRIQQVDESITQLTQTKITSQEHLNTLLQQTTQLEDKILNQAQIVDNIQSHINTVTNTHATSLNNVISNVKQLQRALEEILNRTDIEKTKIEEVSTALTALRTLPTLTAENIGSDQVQGAINRAKSAASAAIQSISQQHTNLINHMTQEQAGMTAQLENNAIATRQASQDFIDSLSNISKLDAFTQMAGAVGQLAMSMTMLTHLVDIFQDETLSTGEKVTQLLMNIGMNIPMIIYSVKSLREAGQMLAITQASVAAQETARNTLTAAGIPITNAAMAAELRRAGAVKSNTAAIIANMIAEKLRHPIILAAIAATGLLTAAIYATVKAYNAEADAAEEANARAETAAKSFATLNEKAQQLKTTISDYSEGLKQLKELDKSTKEYKTTLEQTNEKAKELIETYKLYDQYHYENGAITIEPDALKAAQNNLEAKKALAESYKYSSQASADMANNLNELTKLRRKIGTLQTAEVKGTTAEGKIVEPMEGRQLSNESILSIINALNNMRIQSKNEYDLAIAEDNFKDTILKIGEMNPAIQTAIEQIVKQREALLTLTDSYYDASKKMEYYASELTRNTIGNKFKDEINELAKDINGKVDEARVIQIENIAKELSVNSRKAQELTQKGLETYMKPKLVDENNWDFWSGNKTLSDTLVNNLKLDSKRWTIDDNKDLIETYAREILNKTDDELSKLHYKGGIWDRRLVDESGNDVIKADDKAMRAALYQKGATESISQRVSEQLTSEDIIQPIQNLMDSAKIAGYKYGTDFTDAMLNALSDKDSQWDLSSIFDRLDPNEVAEMNTMSGEQLRNFLGITDDIINSVGVEKAQALLNGFKQGLEKYSWDIDSAIAASINKQSEDLEAAGEGLSKSKLDKYKDEVAAYAKNLMEVAENQNEVSEAMKYNSDLAVDFALRVIKMNKAIDTLADNIENWTDIINHSSETSQEYAEAIYGIEDAIADVYNIESKYVSQKFVKTHLSEIQEIATGSEAAIESLRDELSEELLVNIMIANEKNLLDSQDNILSSFKSVRQQIEEVMTGIKVGDSVDDSSLVTALNKIIQDTHMTVAQANDMFSALKLEPKYATDIVEQEQITPRTQTKHVIRNVGWDTSTGIPLPTWTTEDIVEELEPTVQKHKIPITAISADGTQPKISGITKAPGGSFNNYSSKNTGGKAPGKASKSSGSKKEPKIEDYLKDEKDFYHDINLELKKYETELARLEGQQEKLFGQDLIENYNKQLETLNKTIDTTNRKIEIARGEMKLVGDYLSQRGVMFDADGYISNYTQIYEDKLRATNGIIDAYNKMSAEEQENYKDAVEAAKKDFDEFVENINRYDEIVSDLIPGLIDDIQEAQDKQIEISISKFNMAIELELDTAKLEKDWAKFQRRILKNITDKQFGYVVNKAKDILETEFKIFYDENNSGIVQNLTQQVLDTQRELEQIRAEGWSEIYGDNEAQALEDLKNYHSQLMEQMEDYQDKIDEVRGSFKELMDEAASRIEEQLDLYEQLRGLINHDINIIKMVYGEDSYSALTPYYEQIEEQYTKELKFRKQQKELYEAEMESAEKHFTKESEEWRTARKNYIDALDAWKEASEQAVQATIDTYVNKIDDIFQTLEMKVTNNLGLDYVSEEWELINKSSDMYLDNLNAMYEVQKLAAKYQDAFDRTDSLSAQRAIRELQESELKDLRERDKLTKYDIERANLKYELMLKQIALEEAQQNKSSLRLRRDSQGNYTYQYVADDDAVKKAEQELGDVYNELYNLDRNRYKDNLDQAYAIYEEFHQKMRDLAANTTMDTEEKERWKALYVEQYGQMINDLLGENELIRQNLRESALAHHMYIMDTDKETFEQMTDAETQDLINKFIDTANPNSILSTHGQAFATVTDLQGKMEEHFKAMDQNMVNDAMTVLAPGWDSAVQAMIDTFTREGKSSNEKAFDAMVKNALEASKTEFDLFGEKVHQISRDSTTDFETLKNEGLDPVIESSKDLVSETDNVVTQYKNLHEVLAGSGGVLDQLGNLETRYKSATDAAKAAADAAHAYTVELQNQMAQEAEAERQRQAIAKAQITQNTKTVSRVSTPSSTGITSNSNGNGGTTTSNGGGGNPTGTSITTAITNSSADAQAALKKFNDALAAHKPVVGQVVDFTGNQLGISSTGRRKGASKTNGVTIMAIDNKGYWPYEIGQHGMSYGWAKLSELSGYRSGGYTGDWANEDGKLAILHKKELVLNATDTENILAAVDAIRSITLGQLSPRQSMMADIAAAAQSMEQNVHIDATFPNVHDASEIEAALNNLTNRASQYANRKENY